MKHLIDINDLSKTQALQLLDTAEKMASTQVNGVHKLSILSGKTVANLFFEDSTRTRLSFEAAAKRLGADVVSFAAKGSSVSKGESLKDTAQTLLAMGIDAVVIRHSSSGAAYRLAHAGWIKTPILNAGDGTHQHPTQALLDAMTLRRHLHNLTTTPAVGSDLSGAKVIIVGDILHSRVARSNVDLLTLLGAEVTLVAPPTLMPLGVENWPCQVTYDFDAALAQNPDALMMLRVQRERMTTQGGGFFPSVGEYHAEYGLNRERFHRLPETAIVMHPGPMNRGLEICAEAADSEKSVILEQVTNGVYVRMAALALLLGAVEF